MRLFLLLISVSQSVGTSGMESIDNWIISDAIGVKSRSDDTSFVVFVASQDSNAPCSDKDQNSGTPSALPPCKAKFDQNSKTTLTKTPIICVTEEKTAGRCVFFYRCAPKTKNVNDNSNSLLEKLSMLIARYSKSPSQCPYALQVCCRLSDVIERPSVEDIATKTITPDVNTVPSVPTKKPTNDINADCVTNDNVPGKCTLFYKCDFLNKTMIDIGPTVLDDIYSVPDKRDANSQSQCSYEYHVCCRLKGSTLSRLTAASAGEVGTEASESRNKNKPSNGNPDECRTEDNVPGKCVLFYRCHLDTKTILDIGPNALDNIYSGLKKINVSSPYQCSYEHQVCCKPKAPSRPPGTATERMTEVSTEPVPSTTTEQTTVPAPCTRKTGEAGVCVRFSQCRLSDFSVIKDGFGLIEFRFEGSRCPSKHICCLLPDTITPSPTKPSTIKLSTIKPSTIKPSTIKPSTIKSSTINPSTTKPSTVKSSNINPSTTKPSTIKPSTIKSSTINPFTTKPSTVKPSTTTLSTTLSLAARLHMNPAALPKGCGTRYYLGINFISSRYEKVANYGEFPWMCAIMQFTFIPKFQSKPEIPRPGDYLGGGSLIHPKVVLAAAHNVAGKAGLLVRAGEWDLHKTNEYYPVQERNVKNVIVHEGFNNSSLHYDIAMLVLETPMDLLAYVGAVCLPPPRARLPSGTLCCTSGWGTDEYGKDSSDTLTLNKMDLPVVGHSTCQDIIRRRKYGHFYNLHSSVMCAGVQNGMVPCVGDGGSPLVSRIPHDNQFRFMLSGILSWGGDCTSKGIPGVYVDVSSVREWIDKKVISEGLDPKVYTA